MTVPSGNICFVSPESRDSRKHFDFLYIYSFAHTNLMLDQVDILWCVTCKNQVLPDNSRNYSNIKCEASIITVFYYFDAPTNTTK